MKADIDEKNNRTDYTYDILNRLAMVTYPDNNIKKQFDYYDFATYTDNSGTECGNRMIQYTDPNQNKFLYIFDIPGIPAPDGTTATTRYVYDPAGNRIKEITPRYYVAPMTRLPWLLP